jgi:hypothetical protein
MNPHPKIAFGSLIIGLAIVITSGGLLNNPDVASNQTVFFAIKTTEYNVYEIILYLGGAVLALSGVALSILILSSYKQTLKEEKK